MVAASDRGRRSRDRTAAGKTWSIDAPARNVGGADLHGTCHRKPHAGALRGQKWCSTRIIGVFVVAPGPAAWRLAETLPGERLRNIHTR